MENNLESIKNQNIYIIGNGVIAKGLAVALTLEGKNVTIIRGSIDGEPAYKENISINTGDKTYHAEVIVSTFSNHTKLDGIILLANKSFGNQDLAKKLESIGKSLPVVFLQNGLGVEDSFIEKGFSRLFRCVLFATSQSVSQNDIRLKVVAPSAVGVIRGSKEDLGLVVNSINTNLFPFRKEEDIQLVIWKKVITNCVFNSICPLLEIDNGVFYRNRAALEIGKKVIAECIAVANAQGIKLTEEDILQNVLAISKMSDGQNISTFQDILNKRETEIETLNFAVAKLSTDGALPVTTMLGEMIKLKSELFRL